MSPDGWISIITAFLVAVGCYPVPDYRPPIGKAGMVPECVITNMIGLSRVTVERFLPPAMGAWAADFLRPQDRSHFWGNIHATSYFPERQWVIGEVGSVNSVGLSDPGSGGADSMRLARLKVGSSSNPNVQSGSTLLVLLPEPNLYGVGSLVAHARPFDLLAQGQVKVLVDDLRHTIFGNSFCRLVAHLGPCFLPSRGVTIPLYGIEVRSQPDQARSLFRFGSLPTAITQPKRAAKRRGR